MAQVTPGVALDILNGQGYTDHEVKQLAYFFLKQQEAESKAHDLICTYVGSLVKNDVDAAGKATSAMVDYVFDKALADS